MITNTAHCTCTKVIYYQGAASGQRHLVMEMNKRWLTTITSVSVFISLFTFCLNVLPISESGMLRSPTINVWGSMYDLSLSNVCFINVGVLVFGA